MPGKYASRKRGRGYKRKRFSNATYIARYADTSGPGSQMSMFLSKFNPFPAVHFATLRYVTKVYLQVQTPAKAPTYYFRANSIHDPDATGSVFGGQPYGHDTYAQLYNHYQVLGSNLTVQADPPNQIRYFGIGCLLQDNNSIIEDEARQLCAMKGASYVKSGNGGVVTVRRSFDTKYMQDKSTQCARFGSDVEDPMYYVIFSIDDEAQNEQLTCLVTITYRVKMWELRDLSST